MGKRAVFRGDFPGFQQRVRGAKRGVSREGKLGVGREDADAVIGIGLRGGQYEGCLRQVRPVGNALHLLVAEAFRLKNDRDRVALVRKVGEHINLFEWYRGHGCLP
ncbi:hypothetical protein D3C72_1873330 [compost metagenome]